MLVFNAPMIPLLAAGPFLSRALTDPPPHLPAAIEREEALLGRYVEAPLPERFRLLDQDLSALYLRMRNYGGSAGIAWLQSEKERLRENVVQGNRYWELVVPNSFGHHTLALGVELAHLPHLTFPTEAPKPPLLVAPSFSPPGSGHWAYLRIESMVSIQDVICHECVARIGATLAAGKPIQTVQFAVDREQGIYYIFHGYHRAMAARSLGADYIFGRIARSRRIESQTYTFDELRSVDHTEHKAIVAAAQGESSPADDPFEDRYF